MDHAGRILSSKTERLQRAGAAYEARGRMLEVRMAAVVRDIREIDAAVDAIGSALESPLARALSLHAAAVKRIAELGKKVSTLNVELALLRGEAIGAKTRAKLATQLAEAHDYAEARKEAERESLEITTLMSASSLRQAGDG